MALRVLPLLVGPAAWAVLTFADPGWVEKHYTRGLYPRVAQLLGALQGAFPFCVGEVAVAVAVLVVFGAVWAMPVRQLLWTTLVAVSLGYAVFVVVWGLNYRRQPLAEQLGLDVRESSVDELRGLADRLMQEGALARERVHEDGGGITTFPGGSAAVLKAAPGWYEAAYPGGRYGPPKGPRASLILSYLGIGGVYDPFLAEPTVNIDVPVFTLPFATLHEMAHGRGVAVEAEANFVAFLVARDHGSPEAQYAAWFAAINYTLAALGRVDPEGAASRYRGLHAGIQRDRAVLRAWWSQYDWFGQDIAHAVNDTYLKSQGVKEGVRSYGMMVDLLLAEARRQVPLGR